MESDSNHNVYAEHLAKLNDSNKVIAADDLFNEQGVLLIKKGAEINRSAAERLVKHKLKQALPTSVSLEKMIDKLELNKAFIVFLTEFPELKYLHKVLRLNGRLDECCSTLNQHSILRQKLTVMKSNMPELFQKAVAGAWFSLAIADQLELDLREVINIVIAALVRDVGMMHIAPDLFESAKQNKSIMQKIIKSHVLISELVLNDVPQLPRLITKAILEHHERDDGAGYPHGKQGSQLCLQGQILAMSDTMQEIVNRYKKQGKGMAHLEGFLTLNTTTFGKEAYNGFLQLVKRSASEAKLTRPESEFKQFNQRLLQTNKIFFTVCSSLEKLEANLKDASKDKSKSILKNFIARLTDMRIKAGVPSREYASWIEHVANEELVESYTEMELIGSMFDEMSWQVDQVSGYIQQIIQSSKATSEELKYLTHCAELIDKALTATNFRKVRG
ncbi:HD-GYP domain-containing protein [Aliikangiella sp. IMCC44653]